MMMWTVLVAVFFLVNVGSSCYVNDYNRTFTIDYKNNQFLKDGEPFRYVSGSMHYFRVPRAYWQDRLRKIRALGLNTVQTYIEWSIHEPIPGLFDFSGENDFEHFIRLAQEEGLLVILRPGPYICTERDLGGYPPWLFTIKPDIVLRTSDETHKKYVALWYETLFPRLQPLLYGNGGPVIMLQIENEYGSYPVCDVAYTTWLRDLYRSYVDDKAVLFTTDGNAKYFLNCTIPEVFATVDFGPHNNVSEAFDPLREIQSDGPLVNSEFYTGRLSHWGAPPVFYPGNNRGRTTEAIVNSTRQLLQLGASFNFYMIHGGTSFGFKSGANHKYKPQITSYDFGAPISESGNLTLKYYAIREVLSEFLPIPDVPISPSVTADYGTVLLDPKVSLFDSNTEVYYGMSRTPRTFESLQLYHGFLLYETLITDDFQGQRNLSTKAIHDRTIVLIDQEIQGILSRTYNITSLPVTAKAGQKLGLLVENQGHFNYMNMTDLKGLVYNVTLNDVVLFNWNHTGYPMTEITHIPSLPSVSDVNLPGYFSGSFKLSDCEEPQDTFVDMTGWTKGVLYVNGFNLGRYWPVEGPQITLYCPGVLLQCQNTIVVMELEAVNPNRTIALIASPIYRKMTNISDIVDDDDIMGLKL